MKTQKLFKLIAAILVLSTITVLNSCKDNISTEEIGKGQIQFSLSQIELINTENGRVRKVALTETDKLKVTIVNGNSTSSNHEIDLSNINGSLASSPVELDEDNYELTKFEVIGEDGNTYYATPMEEAPLAYLVDDPLPIEFDVSSNATTTIVPEVLATENRTPQEFGYAEFRFTVVETFDLMISAVIDNSGTSEATTATISVSNDGNVFYESELAANVNNIKLRSDYDDFLITISKDGYDAHSQTYTKDQLLAYSTSPLEIVLTQPTIDYTFVTTWETTTDNESITIPTNGSGYDYTIEWGDGSEETGQTGDATHTYSTAGTYTVSISGDFPSIFFNRKNSSGLCPGVAWF